MLSFRAGAETNASVPTSSEAASCCERPPRLYMHIFISRRDSEDYCGDGGKVGDSDCLEPATAPALLALQPTFRANPAAMQSQLLQGQIHSGVLHSHTQSINTWQGNGLVTDRPRETALSGQFSVLSGGIARAAFLFCSSINAKKLVFLSSDGRDASCSSGLYCNTGLSQNSEQLDTIAFRCTMPHRQ